MTIALPSVLPPPVAPQSRDAAGALAVDAKRPLRAAREVETARAPRPVDAPGAATDPRLNGRRDQPVGPPPAFTINLLQHLRETALDPPAPASDAGPETTEKPHAAATSEPHPQRDDARAYDAAGHGMRASDAAPTIDLKF